jgi:hypothetical protein
MRVVDMKARWLLLAGAMPLLALAACGGGEPPTFAIGDRVEVKGYPDIVVEEFTRTTNDAEFSGEFLSHELEAGHELLVVSLRVINDTDKPAGIDDLYDLTLLSRGEDITEGTSFWFAVEGGLEADMLPVDAEATGLVVWEAPQGFDDLALQYAPGTEELIQKAWEELSEGHLLRGDEAEPPGGRYIVNLEPE